MDLSCLTNQQVHPFYSKLKHRITGNNVAKSREVCDNLQREVCFNQKNSGVDRITSVAKMKGLEENVRRELRELFPKDRVIANQRISVHGKN